MTEKNYYRKFKESLDLSLLKYFGKLNLEDWIDFFNDYYRHDLTYLLRILDTPKGEDIYSYGLIWLNEVDSNTKKLITRSNERLLSIFINENNSNLLEEIFKGIRYLKLDVNKDLLFQIISNINELQKIRELAAATLIAIHENSAGAFWENLDLEKDTFLIPLYVAFHRKNNPIRGLKKLKLITERPQNIAVFETPIVYSLLQISTSSSSVEEYKMLQGKFPSWATTFIKELFDDYPELDSFKEKIQKPYEHVLEKIGLNYSVLDDNSLPIEIKEPLYLLLKRLKENTELIEVVNQKEYTIIDPPYIGSTDNSFTALKQELISLNIGMKNDPKNEKVFEPVESIFLYDQPVIFLYPYFLDDYRMMNRGAGVIPYAKQTSISIVIHKQNDLYYKWLALRDSAEAYLKNGGSKKFESKELDRAISESESETWLKELIQHLYKANGKIHSIRGYVFDSLIQQFAKKHISSAENKKMIEVLAESTYIKDINRDLPFYRPHSSGTLPPKSEILLLDPADAHKVSHNGVSLELKELNTNYYDIVTVKHNLKVSVGIGFSLYILPRLLKNKNWKILQDFIVQELQTNKELLQSVGIHLFELESKTIKKQNTLIV